MKLFDPTIFLPKKNTQNNHHKPIKTTFTNGKPNDKFICLQKRLKNLEQAPEGQKFYELRKVSFLFGGFVGGGSISFEEAEQILKQAIDQKEGVRDYDLAYRTIRACLLAGQNKPLYEDLDDNAQVNYVNDFPIETNYQWPEPKKIERPLPPVETMTEDMLPEAFRDWLPDIAYRMQCPLDYIGTSAIVLVGSLIGANCGIQPKQKDYDWVEVPNLWGAIIGAPSQLKTACIKAVMAPLSKLEAENRENFSSESTLFKNQLEDKKLEIEALKSRIKKALKEDNNQDLINDLKNQKEELSLSIDSEPALRRYKTDDATIEKIGAICEQNPQGIMVIADELVRLLSSWERPGREQDRAFYLESWSGTNTHIVDRVGRGTLYIENLCLSVFGGTQPDKFVKYLHETRNGGNDGMIQRFQLTVYPDEPKNWTYVDEFPNTEGKKKFYKIIELINELDYLSKGARKSEFDKIPALNFDEEAQMLFQEWLYNLEHHRIRNDEFEPLMQQHFGKYRSLIPSLALIFHVIDIVDKNETHKLVSADALKMAIRWGKYLESHANRIYNGLGNPYINSTYALAKKISTGKLNESFTAREIQQKGWQMLNSIELISDAIDNLVEANWLKEIITEKKATGRPPAPKYIINPHTRNFIKNT